MKRFFILKQINWYKIVTRGTRKAGIEAPKDGKHKGDCKKPEETSKAGYKNITPFIFKRACSRKTITHVVQDIIPF